MTSLLLALGVLLAIPAGPAYQASAAGRATHPSPIDLQQPAGACGQVATFEDGLSPSIELHVATTGSDLTGSGTPGNPFASIERAADAATPGTSIVVHSGTYAGGQFISSLAGTAGAPIWIGGASGEPRPVLSGGTNGIQFSRGAYLIVHDLEVTGASGNGINTDDGGDYGDDQAAHHMIFRDLSIHDIGGDGNQDCLKLSGVNDYLVLDSEFSSCGGGGSGSGIDHVGCHHGLIAGNYFHDNSANAIQTKGGSEDIEIRGNHIVNGGQRSLNMGGSTGFTFFRPPLSETSANAEARDIRAVASLIEGSVAPIAFVGCVDCLAANNTIVNPENWLLRILQETTSTPSYEFEPSSYNAIANNIFYFDRSAISTYVNIGPNTAAGTFTFSNNLWYAHDNPAGSEPILPAVETNGIYEQDPGFVDGYRIGQTSPAFRAGTQVSGVASDILWQCYGLPPSIGAYEVLFDLWLPLIAH